MGLTGRGIGVAGEPGRRDLRERGKHADVSLRWSMVPTRGATWSSDGGSSLLMMNTGFGSAFPVSSKGGPACEQLQISSRHGTCSRAGNRTLSSWIPYSVPVIASISSTASRGRTADYLLLPFPTGRFPTAVSQRYCCVRAARMVRERSRSLHPATNSGSVHRGRERFTTSGNVGQWPKPGWFERHRGLYGKWKALGGRQAHRERELESPWPSMRAETVSCGPASYPRRR